MQLISRKTAFLVMALYLGVLLTFFQWGCSLARKYRQSVQAPVPAADLPFQTFRFPSDSSRLLVLSTGTQVLIPAQAFRLADGTLYQGEVEFRVREFHTVRDLVQAGVPMSVDASRKQLLQTAGMIEVRARGAGGELELREGRSLEISLAGYRSPAGYDLYYLEEGKRWSVQGRYQTDSNRAKISGLAVLDTLPPAPEDPTVDTGERVIQLVTDLERNGYLKPFADTKWLIASKDWSPEVERSLRINWDDIKVVTRNRRQLKYCLLFSRTIYFPYGKRKKVQFKVNVTPVYKGVQREEARKLFAAQLEAYTELSRKYAEEKKRLEQQADLLNRFSADKLGIWNVDRIMKMDCWRTIKASFDFEAELEQGINQVDLYVLYKRDNSYITYHPADWNKLVLDPAQDMELIALLPHDSLAVVPAAEVKTALADGADAIRFKTIRESALKFLSRK